MAKIGHFKDDAARDRYLRAYEALATLWPLPSDQLEAPTSFGPTHVRRSGSGDATPVLALHGFPGNGLTWHGAVTDLAQDRAVYAPDTMGAAGRSVQTRPMQGDADLARWFSEMLDGLGLDRVHVLGESQGAWHAALVALHAPQRVASVTLVEPNGVITRTPWRAVLTMLRLGARPSDDGWRRVGAWMTPGATLADEELTCAKAALGFRTSLGWARPLSDTELDSLTAPMLVIFGAESVLSEPGPAERRLARHRPDAEVETYPGRGHGVRNEIPGTVHRRIRAFLTQHDPAPASPPDVPGDRPDPRTG